MNNKTWDVYRWIKRYKIKKTYIQGFNIHTFPFQISRSAQTETLFEVTDWNKTIVFLQSQVLMLKKLFDHPFERGISLFVHTSSVLTKSLTTKKRLKSVRTIMLGIAETRWFIVITNKNFMKRSYQLQALPNIRNFSIRFIGANQIYFSKNKTKFFKLHRNSKTFNKFFKKLKTLEFL